MSKLLRAWRRALKRMTTREYKGALEIEVPAFWEAHKDSFR